MASSLCLAQTDLAPVESVTMAEILATIATTTVIVKMDIEGYECQALQEEVLLGRTGKSIPYIFLEWMQLVRLSSGVDSMPPETDDGAEDMSGVPPVETPLLGRRLQPPPPGYGHSNKIPTVLFGIELCHTDPHLSCSLSTLNPRSDIVRRNFHSVRLITVCIDLVRMTIC